MEAGVNPEVLRLDELVRSGNVDPLVFALVNQQLGRWASDHSRESELLRGWNHIGIMPICKMAASASFSIRIADPYDNTSDENDRGKPLLQKHPLTKLVRKANPWMMSNIYRWEIAQQMHLHGSALVWRVRDKQNYTRYRIPIPMALTAPFPAGRYIDCLAGGIEVKPIESIDLGRFSLEASYSGLRFASGRRIGIDDLIIYRYPHAYDLSDGHSPTSAGGPWIELMESIDEQRQKDAKRGSSPKVLITPPSDVSASSDDLDSFQKRMDTRLANNKGTVVAIPHGSATVASFTPEEMAYSAAFDQIGRAILALHGTSKAAAGLQDQMTYGSLSASFDATAVMAVQPLLDILSDEDTSTIAAEYDENITIAYKAPAIKNPEHDELKLVNDLASGTLTVGEYREARGKNRFGDARDDLIAGSIAAKEWVPPAKSQQKSFAIGADFVGPAAQPAATQTKAKIAGGRKRPYVIAVDLDGTLASYDGDYDAKSIGMPRDGAVESMRMLSEAGAKIAIFTVRDDEELIREWLDTHGIPFDFINENPLAPATTGKIMADLYWDDRAVSAEGPIVDSLVELCRRINDKDVRESLRAKLADPQRPIENGYLYIPIEGKVAAAFKSLARSRTGTLLVKAETHPHITLLPLIFGVTAEEAVRMLRPAARFHIRFSELNYFPANEDRPTDCLYHAVESSELDELHNLVSDNMPHVATYGQWTPHATIAFVAPGSAGGMLGRAEMTGTAYPVDKLIYEAPGGAKVVIPLRKLG